MSPKIPRVGIENGKSKKPTPEITIRGTTTNCLKRLTFLMRAYLPMIAQLMAIQLCFQFLPRAMSRTAARDTPYTAASAAYRSPRARRALMTATCSSVSFAWPWTLPFAWRPLRLAILLANQAVQSGPRIGGSRMAAGPVVCPSCGVAPHEGARFCEACGSALVASAEPAEYKQVTVHLRKYISKAPPTAV